MDIPGRKYSYGESLYSDWTPRGGDNVIIRAELIDYLSEADGTKAKLTIKVFTKNREDTTDGSVVQDSDPADYKIEFDDSDWSDPAPTDPVVKQFVVESSSTSGQGLLELVRLKCAVDDGQAGDYLAVRIFPPIFFDVAK